MFHLTKNSLYIYYGMSLTGMVLALIGNQTFLQCKNHYSLNKFLKIQLELLIKFRVLKL